MVQDQSNNPGKAGALHKNLVTLANDNYKDEPNRSPTCSSAIDQEPSCASDIFMRKAANEGEIKKAFEWLGISSCTVALDSNGDMAGYDFLHFYSADKVEIAVNEMNVTNKKQIDGHEKMI